MLIVEPLEMVHVDHEQPERLGGRARRALVETLGERFVEAGAVGDRRQLVRLCLVVQLEVLRLELGRLLLRLLGEDRLVMGDGAGDSSLQEQIDTLTSEALAAGSYHSDAVQRKLQPLYRALHGTAVADGQVM